MAQIVNNDKLTLILTQYGLNRVAEALSNPSLNLCLSKIKFGSGKNFEYYTPLESQTSLLSPIPEADFYVYKKELLEDNLTISFYTIIPENIGGFDIREVGLYEVVDGEDKLFAVGTCQPFVKPTTADNYFIAVDYYIFLKAADLSKVYEQIVLDAEHALVTDADLEELMRTFLFSNANLINQIGNNSRIIGYNRATQLYEKIEANKTSFSYLTLYKNFASLMDMTSPESIFSFWAFDYSRRAEATSSIVDLSLNANFLSTTVPVASIEKVYHGFMSMFKMQEANFFLDPEIPVRLYEGSSDIPFVMAFALSPLPLAEGVTGRTLLAKSNYANGSHVFEFQELSNDSVQVRLFTDSENYITFTSNTGVVPHKPHSLVLSYDPDNREFTTYINSNKIPMTSQESETYTHMQELPGVVYKYSCTPPANIIYANSSDTSPVTELYNEDGTTYEDGDWEIRDGIPYYEGTNGASYVGGPITKYLYKWTYTDSENTYSTYTLIAPVDEKLPTDEVTFYLSNWEIDDSDNFGVTSEGEVYYLQPSNIATPDPTGNVEREIFEWSYQIPTALIWANSSTNPTILYDYETKAIYTGTDWTIVNGNIYYLGYEASYTNITEDSQYPELASYILNNQGEISQPINSEVGLVTIIKDKMEEEKVKALSLLLCATMGINPYMGS